MTEKTTKLFSFLIIPNFRKVPSLQPFVLLRVDLNIKMVCGTDEMILT